MMRYAIIILLLFTSSLNILAQDNLLEVNISNQQPYRGELITYSIKFTSSFDLADAQIQLPSFVGFAQQPSTVTLTPQNINGVILNVLQQDITLYANRLGELTIEATSVVVPETPFQSGIQIDSDVTSMTVLPLPDNPPNTFSGAVGQFDVRVSLEPPTVQAGEPNLLSIAVTGKGNFDQITSPPLSLPATWEVFERPAKLSIANTSTNVQTKTFEYQFFADETGNIDIPAVLFTFFDPLTSSYKTVEGQAGSVTVEGEFSTSSQTAGTAQDSRRLELKPMSDRPETFMPVSWFWILWIIPPVIAIIAMFMRLATHPIQVKSEQPAQRTQSKSFKAVAALLTQARKYEPNQICTIVEQTLLQYLSARYKQDLTPNEIPSTISSLPPDLQQRIIICFEQAQAGQYAPITPEDAEKLIRRTYKTLQLLEEERI